jgi:hypothetical protein
VACRSERRLTPALDLTALLRHTSSPA